MAMMADAQRNTFEDRLRRISKGGPNTSGELIVGPQEDPKVRAKRRRRMRKGKGFFRRLADAIANLILLPVGFAIGGIAMLAGVVVSYHVEKAEAVTQAVADAQSALAATAVGYSEIGIAIVLALVLGWLFKLLQGPRKIGILAGLGAAFVMQDALIASYPDVFAKLMSDEVSIDAALASLSSS